MDKKTRSLEKLSMRESLTLDTASTSLLPKSASDERVLMGVAPRQRSLVRSNESSQLSVHSMVLMTEVVPANGNLISGDDHSWRIPLSAFSDKKAVNQDPNTRLTRRMRSYYKAQDELITAYETLQHGQHNSEGPEYGQKVASIMSKISFAANFVLLVAKIVAAALSSSISIISSLVDSVVDLLSGIIIWWTSSTMKKRNPHLYPSGRTKLEPVAIVILSVVMSLASLQLTIESIQKIISLANHDGAVPQFDVVTIVIAASTVVIKLALFLMCYFYRRHGSSVAILMQDHRNDIVSNTVAIVCGYLGSAQFVGIVQDKNVVFIDPIGAIIIGFFIFISWWRTGAEQIKLLTGHTAKPDFLSKLTWISLNHHKEITHIDTVRAFHFGNNYLVEVDIVLPETMSLGEAHNIGESLQQRLENLDRVERAFVHLDYETTHRPEEEHKTV
ncbi:metal tolerance protein 9-like [Haliotis rufescens]|uniref:metal tolerance protein 9-like n=1 Tax=Haliotis rufescens TaxID=6454 RepID=UPI00201E99FE|nr:metal tolerance protein 9-like [Haliotis rufescens]XP_048241140.1 metal tolerance protein 9-like [Haliotis rufescens]XP_048241141.1 metal tolerance protein 9-like [Haliotis rufescens]